MRLLALSLVAFALPAHAAATRFGDSGAIVPIGSLQATYSSNGSLNQTVLGFSPGALFFFTDNVAVGAQLDLTYLSYSVPDSTTQVSATSFGIAPTLALNVPIAERVSFLPALGVRIGSSTPFSIVGASHETQTRVTVQAFAPMLFHVAPHFFLGAGPVFSLDVYASNLSSGARSGAPKTTSFGAQSIIGGWF